MCASIPPLNWKKSGLSDLVPVTTSWVGEAGRHSETHRERARRKPAVFRGME